MKINNEFELPLPLDEAWPLLLDVPAIAPCVPGAELTEVLGDNSYRGRASIKVGPLMLNFAGEAQLTEIDPVNHSVRILAKGTDTKKRGNASATVLIELNEIEPNKTRVSIETDLNLAGSIAQYGRASGLLKQIAQELINQFAGNLSTLRPQDGREGGASADGLVSVASPDSAQAMSGIDLLWRASKAWLKDRGSA